MSPRANTPEDFWANVKISAPTECWPWLRYTQKGYGRTRFGGKSMQAHRVAWQLTNGPVPLGLVLDHLCRNRGCCNPAHLEPVTNEENLMRGDGLPARNSRLSLCRNGHPFDKIKYRKDGRVERLCTICQRAHDAKYRRKSPRWLRRLRNAGVAAP
jgi:hypothetical protein